MRKLWYTINGVVNNGGICGYNRKGMIDSCFNLGTVNGTRYSGGIYGRNTDGITENCFNAGDVNSAKDYSGGIAGEILNNGTWQTDVLKILTI